MSEGPRKQGLVSGTWPSLPAGVEEARPWPQRMAFLGALVLAIAILNPTASARASYDPVGAGSVKLTLARPFQRLLSSHGVTLQAGAPAKGKGRSLTLPASGGSLEPTSGKGEIDTKGVLSFTRGRLSVPLRRLTVKTSRQPLLAKVGGGQLKLAKASRLSSARRGFGSTFIATGLRLTPKLATRLSKKLHLHDVFTAGQRLGTLQAVAMPETIAILPQNRATFVPDPAFIAKLDAAFVSLNPIAPAERSAGPIFSFPIIGGGALAPDTVLGTLRTGGALEFLHLGSGQVFWTEPWFDLGSDVTLAEADIEPSPTYPGKLGQLPLLDLGQGATSADPKAHTITVNVASLTLNSTAAAQFNLALANGKEVFHAGEPFGSVSFTAQTQ
jgi:hypothetical protein